MGIEQFFSTISKQFNVVTIIKDTNYDIIDIDYIFMDFNSVIHNISSSMENVDDLLIIENINIFLINFLKRFNLDKLKLLYIGLDGVPSFSKILEQRKRRFVGNIINSLFDKKNHWSKNNISPGTNFMDTLSKYLHDLKICPNIKISDSNEIGEGEMKILDLINNLNPDDKVIFFSPDSDVILLSMISINNNIKIIKQEKKYNIYSIINISVLKEIIYKYCLERVNIELIFDRLIHDLVFIFSIFGNDFLPKCESINTNLDILFLIDMYLINLIDNDYIIENSNINSKSLYHFFDLLKTHERRLLFRNAFINIYNNYNIINQINFIIDLYKLKKNSSLYGTKFGEPFYNFYNNVLSFINPIKLNIKHEKYGYLYFYLMEKNKLLNLILNTSDIISTINSIINVKISSYDEYSQYQPIRVNEFKSNFGRHANMIKNLTDPNERELYLIENKLDKYFKIFNPINEFFRRSIKLKKIDIDYYYKTYFNYNTEKQIVDEYLKGLRWVYQYYFIRKDIDCLWHYPYNKTPLFETIIKYYTPHNIIIPIKGRILDIEPHEQLLYITPKCSDEELNKLFPEKYIKKIKKFMLNYSKYFLENITIIKEGMFDCSTSHFVNKCNYKLLDNIIDITEFVRDFRKNN